MSKAGRLIVVVGGQYGSEGKGAVAGHLSKTTGHFVGVRVAGPNAGHTVIGVGPDGEENYPWRLRTVPVNAVTNPESDLIIAAGSEIDMPVLLDELDKLDRAGYQATSRLLIDDQATILSEDHHHFEEESQMHERLGSTGKGIGAARADRILRKASLYGGGLDTSKIIKQSLQQGATVLIEGTQGYGLGLHAGNYPYCTSSDCRAIDFLAMAGVNPWDAEVGMFDVYVTLRTYPIRVAGNSGPMLGETSWEALGFEPERTTVTQKIRRVGTWDADLARIAVAANGGAPTVKVALTMFDYVFPAVKNQVEFEWTPQIQEYVQRVQREVVAPVTLLGTGPSTMAEI